ncbi:MAG: UBP-type zinc finger domain-containing protein [Acidimicrobiales bacterium]
MADCRHVNDLVPTEDGVVGPPPGTDGCEECLALNARWVHLRRCLECGHVGCCDSSPNRHASAHFHATMHPLVQSFEPGEEWLWCYADELMIQPVGVGPSPSHR